MHLPGGNNGHLRSHQISQTISQQLLALFLCGEGPLRATNTGLETTLDALSNSICRLKMRPLCREAPVAGCLSAG
jgi:hypothetical protein